MDTCYIIMIVSSEPPRISYRVFISEWNADQFIKEHPKLSLVKLEGNVEDAYEMSDAWWE